ncbi:amidinotransferase [Kordiimonas sediminis]|uniref:arginine deiminase n=1 Tax=Kordiimonas sediminis TaxID=1735581 RepID=A0A919E4G9_9PROT|nr:arginine deiminase family protein [Kordiimonas sediminis]GHF12111.1 amidinotransferase [Kordiimonas sediminis]
MSKFNEYSQIEVMAVRNGQDSFKDEARLDRDWEVLRFHSRPMLDEAIKEHAALRYQLRNQGVKLLSLPADEDLTLDSIYVRDALLVSPKGLIVCNMGRKSRRPEARINAEALQKHGYQVAGEITAPGTLEGGDFIWIDERSAAVGRGPRTNDEGIKQLADILGKDVDLHVVDLPSPDHPDDVLHLMSIISPVDKDLAVVYRPWLTEAFADWLQDRGILFVEVPDDEFLAMGCNVLAVAPRKVIMLDELPRTKARLEAAGCDVMIYKGDEISRKGEGGPTCLTRPLLRR